MKNNAKLFLMSCMAAGLFSCSSEEGDIAAPGQSELSGEQVYMQFKLNLPSTRSQTNPNGGSDANLGVEVGSDAENKVNTVQLVLVDPETKKVIATSSPASPGQPGSGNSLTPAGSDMYVAAFQSSELVAYAGNVEKTVNVIAYCNTTSKFKGGDTFDEKETMGAANVADIWAPNKFVMTNANNQDMVGKLPTKAELAKHNTPNNPCIISDGISVERLAARFDFAKANVTFPMLVGEKQTPEVNIVLTDMAMFNVSNDIYKLRRVSADGTDNGATIFGLETASNYVVDVANHGFLETSKANLQWKHIADLSVADNEKWNDQTAATKSDYYFWRYGVENAYAKDEVQHQRNATGVAFKANLTPGAKCPAKLKATLDAGKEPIYVFNDVLYGDWARVELAATEGKYDGVDAKPDAKFAPNPVLNDAWKAVNQKVAAEGISTDEAAKALGFKVFKPNAEKYEVYYNYYNRHNDNGNYPGEILDEGQVLSGPMEFAVVRNNVYKLKVDKITKYGDPDWVEPDPTKPIESDDIFFQVTVKVLPWVVRVNNIEL